jgi:hypothetical protein
MQRGTEADILFQQISSDYPVWERAVRDAAPELADSDVQDRALRSVLAQLRFDPSAETFRQLKERLARVKRETKELRDEAAAMRDRTRELVAAAKSNAGEGGKGVRTFRDSGGLVWSVREKQTDDVPWGRARHCLVFSSDMAVRRIWGVPADWQALSDAELERLSWGT